MGLATDCSGVLHLGLQGLDLSSIRQTPRALPSSACPRLGKLKAPLPQGQGEPFEEGFYANGEIYNSLPTQNVEEHHFVPGLMWRTLPMSRAFCRTSAECGKPIRNIL